jgi:hypothetical protein
MVDKSEVELTDVASGTTFTLVLGETNYEEYVEAKLTRAADGEELLLREGDTLALSKIDKQAALTAARPEDKACVFTVGEIEYTVTTKE